MGIVVHLCDVPVALESRNLGRAATLACAVRQIGKALRQAALHLRVGAMNQIFELEGYRPLHHSLGHLARAGSRRKRGNRRAPSHQIGECGALLIHAQRKASASFSVTWSIRLSSITSSPIGKETIPLKQRRRSRDPSSPAQ